MTIDDVLFFDTETTGIPERSWNWDTDFDKYPHVVQTAKAPEIENSAKITGFAAELLDANEF